MNPPSLLSDEAFARRIAIGLLGDREHAEDLVQEAWLEILEKRPRGVRNPGGFLALLLRRLSLRTWRDRARRTARERASARREAQGDTAALVARAEIHQRTVAAVLTLEEPYRSTILLRFFEDRTPAEIAVHAGIPLETARTRLKRALAMLRARLEKEGRQWREEWAVALAGARSWPDPEPVPRFHLSWGKAASVAAVILVAWFVRPEQAPLGARLNPAGQEVADTGERVQKTELAPSATHERFPLEPGESVPGPAGAFLSGRVRDEMGRPLSGVHVQVAVSRYKYGGELSDATSDEIGSFSCSLASWNELSPPARGLLGLYVKAWRSGRAPSEGEVVFSPDGLPEEPDLVLLPGRLLSGRVLDSAGEPVASANVAVHTNAADSRTSAHELVGPTNRDGWFAFGLEEGERVIAVLVYKLAQGFAHRAEEALSPRTTGDIVLAPITLERGHALRGRCIHPDGTPAPRLRLQLREVQPDRTGGFCAMEHSLAELADGIAHTPLTTDELGRFEAFGFGDGLFQAFDDTGPLGGGDAWRSDGSDIEIVSARHRLFMEVKDPTGRPLELARIAVTRLSSSSEPAAVPVRTFTSGTPPVATLTVVPGETLAVLAAVPGCSAVEERFVVPNGTYTPRLRLDLVPDVRRATLVLHPSAGSGGDWRVDLCAAFSGMPLPGLQDLLADAEGRVHGMPLGRYRVRIEAQYSAGSGTLPKWCALDTKPPVVLAEGETHLEFRALPAARLRIVFTGASAAAGDLEPIQDLEASSTDRLAWMKLSLIRSRGSLELWPLGSETGEPLRRVTELRPKAGQFLDLVVPALPARLRLVLSGREPFERELDPIPGETLEISIPLSEKPLTR